jgi:hypothetical protein
MGCIMSFLKRQCETAHLGGDSGPGMETPVYKTPDLSFLLLSLWHTTSHMVVTVWTLL